MGLLTLSLFADEKAKAQRSEMIIQGLLTCGSKGTVGELELGSLVPALLSCRSLRHADLSVLSRIPGDRKDCPGYFVLPSADCFWNQIEVRMLADGFHIALHGIQA